MAEIFRLASLKAAVDNVIPIRAGIAIRRNPLDDDARTQAARQALRDATTAWRERQGLEVRR